MSKLRSPADCRRGEEASLNPREGGRANARLRRRGARRGPITTTEGMSGCCPGADPGRQVTPSRFCTCIPRIGQGALRHARAYPPPHAGVMGPR